MTMLDDGLKAQEADEKVQLLDVVEIVERSSV
jgi:hypothetical protein